MSSPSKQSSPSKSWSSPSKSWPSPSKSWPSPSSKACDSRSSPYKRKQQETFNIGGYVHMLSPIKIARSNRQYFDFKLNSGDETIKCVCFDVDKWPFFQLINDSTDFGALLSNVTRPAKDIMLNSRSKVSKYKPEFKFTEFKKPITTLAYVINEADIYDEIDVIGKIFNFSEIKTSASETRYIETEIIDKTKSKRTLKIFNSLIEQVKEGGAYKLTDVKVILGHDQKKILHTTTSTKCTESEDIEITSLEVTQTKKENQSRSIEGKVISIDTSSMSVLHLCSKCSTPVELESGFYCCQTCGMMGTMESVKSSKQTIDFCFLDSSNQTQYNFQCDPLIIENITGYPVLNKIKFATQLCKIDHLLIEVDQNNIVLKMENKNN